MDAEVIVVGGGVNGLWAACHLAKQGIKSILFEQFPLPHTRGSSHGQSRLTRSSYVEEAYARIMPECHESWRELGKKTGREVFIDMGLLTLYNTEERGADVESAVRSLKQLKIRHEVIQGQDLSRHFPGFFSGAENKCVLDKEAGLLKADACLLALQELYEMDGGKVCDGEPVLSLNVVNDANVEVKTVKRIYSCKSVILTCGPYANEVLSSVNLKLPIEAIRALVYYWTDKSGHKYNLSSGFPGTIIHPPGHTYLYTLPVYEYPGLMKICYHCDTVIDPKKRDNITEKDELSEKAKLEWLKSEIKEWFPDIDSSAPAITEVCMLTRSPDEKFIVDFHPKYKNIAIGTGFSGRGFKTAPAIGRMLACMATNRPSPYPLEIFALKRFQTQSKI